MTNSTSDVASVGRGASEGTTDAASDGVRAVLWTRRPACGARVEAIDRLSGLVTADVFDEFTVETLPTEVVLTDSTDRSWILEAFEEFERWGAANGVSVSPPFERRTVTSLVGQTTEVLRVPVRCLSVSDGDGLRGVYPCSTEERTWTVTDYLDAVEAAGGLPSAADDSPVPTSAD